MASGNPRIETIAAELSSIAESIERHRARVASLAEGLASGDDSDREDLVTAIFEAERSLIGAERLVRRAVRTAR